MSKSDQCKNDCIDEGLNFCHTSDHKAGYCCEADDSCKRNKYCSYDVVGTTDEYMYWVCPIETSCGTQYSITPSSSGAYTEIETYTDYDFVKPDICKYLINWPGAAVEGSAMLVVANQLRHSDMWFMTSEDYDLFEFYQEEVQEDRLYLIRDYLPIYLVVMADSIFQGKFNIHITYLSDGGLSYQDEDGNYPTWMSIIQSDMTQSYEWVEDEFGYEQLIEYVEPEPIIIEEPEEEIIDLNDSTANETITICTGTDEEQVCEEILINQGNSTHDADGNPIDEDGNIIIEEEEIIEEEIIEVEEEIVEPTADEEITDEETEEDTSSIEEESNDLEAIIVEDIDPTIEYVNNEGEANSALVNFIIFFVVIVLSVTAIMYYMVNKKKNNGQFSLSEMKSDMVSFLCSCKKSNKERDNIHRFRTATEENS